MTSNSSDASLAMNAADITQDTVQINIEPKIKKIETTLNNLFSDNPFMRSDYGLGISASYGPAGYYYEE